MKINRVEMYEARRRDMATDLAHQLLLLGELLQNTRELDDQGPHGRSDLHLCEENRRVFL